MKPLWLGPESICYRSARLQPVQVEICRSLKRIRSEISRCSVRLDWACGSVRSLNKTAKTLNTNGRAGSGSAPARRFKLFDVYIPPFPLIGIRRLLVLLEL